MNLMITGGNKSNNKTISEQFGVIDDVKQSFALGLIFLYSYMLTVCTLQTYQSSL